MNADEAQKLVREANGYVENLPFDEVMYDLYDEIRENSEGGMDWMNAAVPDDIYGDVVRELKSQGYRVTHANVPGKVRISWESGDGKRRDLSRFHKYVDAKIIHEVETAHFVLEPDDFFLIPKGPFATGSAGICALWNVGETRIELEFHAEEKPTIVMETQDAVKLLNNIFEDAEIP